MITDIESAAFGLKQLNTSTLTNMFGMFTNCGFPMLEVLAYLYKS